MTNVIIWLEIHFLLCPLRGPYYYLMFVLCSALLMQIVINCTWASLVLHLAVVDLLYTNVIAPFFHP
uniref:Uncharacterized protein n=1 Tax=Arundo donax TaxID=35708 RepID=A0A0A9HFM5_ARUDO